MMRRLRWVLLIVTVGACYFDTPTHEAPGLDDDDAASSIDPKDGGSDSGSGDEEGGIESDAGELEPGEAGMDASLDGSVGSDAGGGQVEAGVGCTCPDPSKQACTAAGTCVECLQDTSCTGGKHCLGSTNHCVECRADNECSAGKHCQSGTNTCVECLQESHCSAGKHCLVGTGQCVACLDSSHCAGLAAASVCNTTTHLCGPCHDAVDAECSNVPGANVCQAGTCVQCAGTRRTACGEDKPSCSTSNKCDVCKADADCSRFNKVCNEAGQQCVACTIDSEAARCGAKSCNPATHACTQTNRTSVGVCGKCVADSECVAGYRCVELSYAGASRGGYCLKRQTGATCESRFRVVLTSRTTLSGAAAESYCGISEERTTCEAVLKFGTVCPNRNVEAECAPAGAVCGNLGSFSCSYPCETTLDCPDSINCPASGTGKFCGKL